MHIIKLDGYNATVDNGEKLILGTFDSYGVEQLQIVKGLDWENLSVIATFNPPNKKPVQVVVDSVTGIVDVPKEATSDLYGVGTIVFVGLADGVQRISVDVEYIVRKHSNASGTEPAEPTPDLLQQVLTLSKDAQTAAKNAEQSAKNAEQSAESAAKDAADTVKPYKEEAVQAATAAALSEKNAAESKAAAQEAAERATQAGIAASNAAEEAERSAGIATDAAGGSALNAENARKSALNAQQSANNAAESQSAAAASAASAQRNAEQVAIDAKTAVDAKVAAAGSADAAAGSAIAAGNSASAAARSEQAAGASEVKAAESEKAAKASEQAAAESAQAALESKTAAATSEVNAAASAKKAQDVADSLPEDYTTAVNDIATLKQQVANITPDDSSIGDKPWSSKNIVDMLCPKIEESGNPVQCYPVAGYPLGVTASWEPMQEGSGEPSPENIRPIKGRDSVTVERCGGNLVKFPYYSSSANKNGLVITSQQDGSVTVNGTATADTWYVIGIGIEKRLPTDTPITLSGCPKGGSTRSYYIGLYLGGTWFSDVGNGNAKIKFTTRKIGSRIEVTIVKGTVCNNLTFYPKIEVGTTITPYSKYQGSTNTLTLPETIYGGSVDAVRGEGQETWRTITDVVDGNNIKFKENGVFWDLPNRTAPGIGDWIKSNIISSHFHGVFSGNEKVEKILTTAQYMEGLFDTVDELNAYCSAQAAAGTPVQISYKLKEPVPFTATNAQPLPALAELNTILTDADSAIVTGRADPIKRITDLEDAVASQT